MGPTRSWIRPWYWRVISVFSLGFLLLCPVGGRGQYVTASKLTLRADDWITINKDYSSRRYVDLDQITPQNVAGLKEVCEIDLNEPSWFSSGILKVGRTLYVTTRRMTYAIDGETCELRWHKVIHDIVKPNNPGNSNNRGAAYLDGRLFRGTADGRMIALDAETGKKLWENPDADQNQKESFIAGPVAWDGKVFTGIATADFGARGRVMGFDAKTGKELWRFYTVPELVPNPPPPLPGQPIQPDYSGGAFWTSFSLDPATGEVFAPVSNPFPDYTGDVRPGDNLYTNSLLSLNADGGSLEFGAGLNWYYQAVPHDIHDWDLGTAPALFTNSDGKNIAAIAGKDGNVYLIDRATHMPIVWPPTRGTTQENGSAPFPANPNTPPLPPTAAVRVCPGAQGGAEFTGTAYSPQLDALYVGMVDWCFFYYNTPAANGLMSGAEAPDYSLGTPPRGWITAIDGNDGHVLWQYHTAAQVQAGPVITKSGILFDGDTLGNLLAFDAKTGSVLKSIDVKGALNSGLISYAVDGTQYLAANVGGAQLNSAGITHPLRVGGPLRVKIFGLTGSDHPKIVKLDRVPQDGMTPERMASNLYHNVCFGCHGPGGAGFAFPPLTSQYHILTDPQRLKAFLESVTPLMPKLYPGLLTDDDVELLVSYFKTLNFPFQPGYTRPTSGGTAGWPEIYSVLTHPRCINCHTQAPAVLNNTNLRFPRQADDRHPHLFGVVAGTTSPSSPPPMGDKGPATELCSSCHGSQNNAFTGAPGALNAMLAPLSMAWESSPNVAMSGNQLCTALKDKSRNGGRDLTGPGPPDSLLEHIETEPLVQWAFAPGTRLDGTPREPAPLSYPEFVAAFTTWANAGGPCPAP
jgi:alcohol dehydrogenase (cytochrome c)